MISLYRLFEWEDSGLNVSYWGGMFIFFIICVLAVWGSTR